MHSIPPKQWYSDGIWICENFSLRIMILAAAQSITVCFKEIKENLTLLEYVCFKEGKVLANADILVKDHEVIYFKFG